MNDRNVEKLIEALKSCRGYVQVSGGQARIEGTLEGIALDLARQGVLAPRALTKDQLGTLAMRSPPHTEQDNRQLLLRNLERAARGEPL